MRHLSFAVLLFAAMNAFSQNTFTTIYNTFQSKCASCHSGGTPSGGLSLSGTETQVYNAIVEVAPANSTAAAKGDKLIDKGYPERSFLLRKCAYGLSDDLALTTGEGSNEPNGQTKIADQDIELIRQWIIMGAPQTGNVVSYQRLVDYYTVGGRPKITKPVAPPAGQGFQIHFGPVFWAGGEESEYFMKHDPRIAQNIEVYKYELYMNSESHHFILRQYQPGAASSAADGLQPFSFSEFSNGKDFVNAWQTSSDLELPIGTGFFWDNSTVLDLNYHMFNSHLTEILPAEVYLNVYTRPRNVNTIEMHAELIPNFTIYIPNNNQNTSFTSTLQRSGQTWNIWMLSTHTHKYGVDYDIFKRNSNGSQGTQLYEGNYNFDYTFNQGFYEWHHPAVERFSPMIQVNMSNGLIHKATYKNNGPDPVAWGFTTDQEMMLIYVQYTTQSVNYKPPISSSSTGPVCNSVTLSTDGGLSAYQWSNGATTQSTDVTQSGTYYVTVTDGSGSTYTSDPISVTVNSASASINNGNDPSICNGQSAMLSASSASSYLWSTGATTSSISVSATGTYGVTITAANGCTASDDAVVAASPGPVVAISDAAFCAGQSSTLDAGNIGSTYLWSTGATSKTITVSGSGNYSVTVTDGSGCNSSDNAVVTVHVLPSLNLSDVTICAGSSVMLDAGNQGAAFMWSTGATTQTISISQIGTYSVTVTDGNNCESTDQSTLSFGTNLSVNLADENVCDGASITLDAGFPGSTYTWSTGATSQTISVGTGGAYSVTVNDGNGCNGSDGAMVAVVSNPVADAGGDKLICVGESVDLTASGGTDYVWSNGETGNTITVDEEGSYNVTVSDGNGCTASDKAEVEHSLVLTGNVIGLTQVETGSSEAYSVNDNAGSSYVWTASNGTISGGQGTFSVQVNWGSIGTGTLDAVETNANGCEGDKVSLQVSVGPTGIANLSFGDLAIYPNPFSETSRIVFPEQLNHYVLTIRDITGKTVYQVSSVSGNEIIISREGISSGLYFAELKGNKTFRGKIIVAD